MSIHIFERRKSMINFTKLWVLMENRGMKKTDLTKNKIISPATLAKLGKNEPINSTVIEKICAFLECQPGDIMEYISEKDMQELTKRIDSTNRALFETLKQQGITEEQFATMMKQAMPDIIKSMFNGEDTINNLLNSDDSNQ